MITTPAACAQRCGRWRSERHEHCSQQLDPGRRRHAEPTSSVLVEMLVAKAIACWSRATARARWSRRAMRCRCLILLDVMMPGIDGFETCRRLQADAAQRRNPGDLHDRARRARRQGQGLRRRRRRLRREAVPARGSAGARADARRACGSLQLQLAQANEELESKRRRRARAELQGRARARSRRSRSGCSRRTTTCKQEICEQSNHREIVGTQPVAAACARARSSWWRATDSTVLIRGETGTGKELIARAIHERSPRRERPLVKLNCSAISAGLVESELFGHVKGAFTGATRSAHRPLRAGGRRHAVPRRGQRAAARHADETAARAAGARVRAGRQLEDAARERARDRRDRTAICRPTLRSGRFRADLFYRLNVFPIDLPPLRERRDDIPALAQFFMERCARKLGKPLRRHRDRHAGDAASARVAGQHPRSAEHDRARRDSVERRAAARRLAAGCRTAELFRAPSRRKKRTAAPAAPATPRPTASKRWSDSTSLRCSRKRAA